MTQQGGVARTQSNERPNIKLGVAVMRARLSKSRLGVRLHRNPHPTPLLLFLAMIRNLRTSTACLCFAASFVVIVLWLRSYWFRDTLQVPHVVVFSWRGQLSMHLQSDYKHDPWQTASWADGSIPLTAQGQIVTGWGPAVWPPKPSLISFSLRVGSEDLTGAFPHWVPIILLVPLALALKPSRQITVRELFTLITIVALALGSVSALPHRNL